MRPLLERLKEPSTWTAFGGLALAAGISQEEWANWAALGAALAGFLLGVVLKEGGK